MSERQLKIAASNDEPKDRKTSVQVSLDLLVDAFKAWAMENGYRFSYSEGSWHVYSNGYWRPSTLIDREDMARVLADLCRDFSILYAKHYAMVWKRLESDQSLRGHTGDFDQEPYVACLNGTVDLLTGELLEHSPVHMTTRAINADYDPEARCPEWESMLDDIFSDREDDVRQQITGFVQEWMGLALAGGADSRTPRALRRALFLYGPPNSGKSTTLDVLRQLLGTDRIVASRPSDVNSKFGLEAFMSASAWITEEVDGIRREMETSRIKCVITGEPVSVQRKNKTDASLRFKGSVAWAGNTAPNFVDGGGAIYSRIITIPVTRTFTEEEAKAKFGNLRPVDWLYEKGEMSGIVNWALRGYYRLLKRQQFEKIPELSSAMDTMREQNDPIFAFVRECLEPADGIVNTASVLAYAAMAYTAASDNTFIKNKTAKSAIGSAIAEQFRDVKVDKDRERRKEGRVYTYTGLALNAMGLQYWDKAREMYPEGTKFLKANELPLAGSGQSG
jgi:P4 family phage/plasmid primase-like protien